MRFTLRIQMMLFLIFSLLIVNVRALKPIQGSIEISLEETAKGDLKENVTFGIMKVADMKDGRYILDNSFEKSDIDLNEIKTVPDLENATKALYALALLKEADFQMSTDKNGKCRIEGLEVGVYLVYAISLNEYDHIDPMLIAIPNFDDATHQMIYDVSVLPKHYPVLSSIQVKKVNSNHQTLENAKFTLYADRNCEKEIETKITDQNGLALFENLERNTYYLKETGAPQGYYLSLEVIEIQMNRQYDENHIYELTLENKKSPVVNTGDDTPMMFLFAVSVGALGGIITFLIQKKREKKK